MRWRGRLSDEERDELKRGSNHFGEQAAQAFLDGVFDIALGSSDRAIRDHEMMCRDDPDDREVVAVLADRLRDRAELRRHGMLELVRTGRGDESWDHARAGITDAERAIELYEAATGDPDPHPLWVRRSVSCSPRCTPSSGDQTTPAPRQTRRSPPTGERARPPGPVQRPTAESWLWPMR